MHADKLYHQMLDYELKVAEAQAAGIEPPPLTSLFRPEARNTLQQAGASNAKSDHNNPNIGEMPQGMKVPAKWDEMTAHEREVEIQSYKAGVTQQKMYAEEAAPFLKKFKGNHLEGKEKSGNWFRETFGR